MNLQKAVATAREIVNERGDFVYNPINIGGRCAYVPITDPRFPESAKTDAAPGAQTSPCLVGEIFLRTDGLTDAQASSTQGVATTFPDLDRNTTAFLRALQGAQDSGASWSQALAEALTILQNEMPSAYAKIAE